MKVKIFLVGFLLCFCALSFTRYQDTSFAERLDQEGTLVNASIIAENMKNKTKRGREITSTILVYEYTVDGKTYQVREEFSGTADRFKEESGELLIKYLPSDPERQMMFRSLQERNANSDWLGRALILLMFSTLGGVSLMLLATPVLKRYFGSRVTST